MGKWLPGRTKRPKPSGGGPMRSRPLSQRAPIFPASSERVEKSSLGRSAPRFSVGGAAVAGAPVNGLTQSIRSEEHTSELQSLMRISYAVFCLKKKKKI